MISCLRCENETRTSELVTAQGPVMVAGTLGTEPQPVIAQVCTACGFIQLFAPHPTTTPARERAEQAEAEAVEERIPTPAVS
ncbi:MAG TPA: hypothetical protein VFT99_09045 [Roseiflexaceae bacterium]|nr:hypothetical protein [Roseiflexaceae bacterium]